MIHIVTACPLLLRCEIKTQSYRHRVQGRLVRKTVKRMVVQGYCRCSHRQRHDGSCLARGSWRPPMSSTASQTSLPPFADAHLIVTPKQIEPSCLLKHKSKALVASTSRSKEVHYSKRSLGNIRDRRPTSHSVRPWFKHLRLINCSLSCSTFASFCIGAPLSFFSSSSHRNTQQEIVHQPR